MHYAGAGRWLLAGEDKSSSTRRDVLRRKLLLSFTAICLVAVAVLDWPRDRWRDYVALMMAALLVLGSVSAWLALARW